MNTRNDDFTEVFETWLQEGSSEEDPNRIMDRALARVDATPQSRLRWLPGVLAFTDSPLRVALAAMALAVVSLAGAAFVTSGDGLGGFGGQPPPAASIDSPAPSMPAMADILGLPPEGASPSDPTPGTLVMRIFSSSSPPLATKIWIYADGRIISSPFLTFEGVDGPYTGLIQQRLTPEWVAYLRSQVAGTGLFEDDLDLVRDDAVGVFEVELGTGDDRFVRVTFAPRVLWNTSAPVATAEQEAAIQSMKTLLLDTSAWPASVWLDDTQTAYVASSYAVCIGVQPAAAEPGEWTGPVDSADVWALLPIASQDILRAGQPAANWEWMHADAGCTTLSTDQARALAQSFQGSPVHRSQPGSKSFVAYEMNNPTAAWGLFWIQFGPVQPDGMAIWLGPG